MKKSYLKSKMVVKTRNGGLWLVVDDAFIRVHEFTTFTEYNEELRCEKNKNYDIVKVYRYINENYNNSNVSDITTMLNEENLKLLWERKKIKLTEREIEVLKALKTLGYGWISRDDNGCLYANVYKPIKGEGTWNLGGDYMYPFKDSQTLFQFIAWEDKEPTNTNDLLEGGIQ